MLYPLVKFSPVYPVSNKYLLLEILTLIFSHIPGELSTNIFLELVADETPL